MIAGAARGSTAGWLLGIVEHVRPHIEPAFSHHLVIVGPLVKDRSVKVSLFWAVGGGSARDLTDKRLLKRCSIDLAETRSMAIRLRPSQSGNLGLSALAPGWPGVRGTVPPFGFSRRLPLT